MGPWTPTKSAEESPVQKEGVDGGTWFHSPPRCARRGPQWDGLWSLHSWSSRRLARHWPRWQIARGPRCGAALRFRRSAAIVGVQGDYRTFRWGTHLQSPWRVLSWTAPAARSLCFPLRAAQWGPLLIEWTPVARHTGSLRRTPHLRRGAEAPWRLRRRKENGGLGSTSPWGRKKCALWGA